MVSGHGIIITLPDKRQNNRYYHLVKGHIQQATSTATGVTIPATVKASFAVTQVPWRFLDNDRGTLPVQFFDKFWDLAT